MFDKIKAKLQPHGETLTETLVALLISSLGLMILAGAITSSSKIISNSRSYMKDYYEKNEALESAENGGVAMTVTLGESSFTIDVTGFVNEKTDSDEGRRVIAYRLKS